MPKRQLNRILKIFTEYKRILEGRNKNIKKNKKLKLLFLLYVRKKGADDRLGAAR